jgi:hypothetical protein
MHEKKNAIRMVDLFICISSVPLEWETVVMSTISGGERDTLIGSHLTQIAHRITDLHIVEAETAFMDDVHIENDHLVR